MSYQLVVAEKPSVAQSLAAVIGAKKRCDGYLEGNGYRVSWCVGHLAGLADAESYDPKYAKWHYEDLPILPENWQFVVRKDKKKQFDILKKLMNSSDTSAVINACDAGREGEAIFRTVYQLAGCQKPMKRLWISSMEDSAIRTGFQNLRSGSDFDGLYQAALCRTKGDWLVGINATRLFSVLYHRTLNIGRVMSPTLAMMVQREAEIDSFHPESFYNVHLALSDFTAVGERLKSRADAEKVQEACVDAEAVVTTVERKEKAEKPPALYDLTTLQREANRLLGFTAQQTLDYLQNLYEKKLCTYPRTDSRYLTSDMEQGLPVLVNTAAIALPFAKGTVIRCNAGPVICDKKVTDHHAIIPTQNIQDLNWDSLPAGERAILELVTLRLLCAVGQPYEYMETTVSLECAGYPFTAKGRAVLNPGWKELDGKYRATLKKAEDAEKESSAKSLPVVSEGQRFEVVVPGIKEGQTSPPKHFTEDSLLAAMETVGAQDMPENAERKGLGTPATRAGIMEKLVSSGFVERKKSKKVTQLLPTDAAASLITVLPEQLQSPLLTAEWEYQLKQVENGQVTPESFMDGITTMVKELISSYQAIPGADVLFPPDREIIGRCPRCGETVTERKQGFFCDNQDCKFVLWKGSKFFSAKKKQLTKELASELLRNGHARLTGCYSEKTGKTYNAVVILEDDGQKSNYRLDFDSKGGGKA